MAHIILLLYLLSGFSGIGSLIFLVVKNGRNTAFMKGFIPVHLSYTLLMLVALILLYLRVNVINSPHIMSLFIMAILLGQGILCWSLSRFSFIVNKRGITPRMRILWNMAPFFYVLLAVLQFFLMETRFHLYPVVTGFSLFLLISVYFSVRNSRVDKREAKENRLWFLFLLFTLTIISLELFLKFKYDFLGEYTVNIPIIFLSWNFITLANFRDQGLDMDKTNDVLISRDKIDLWQLTEREIEIARAVIRGNSNKEIASDLNISFSTVKNHIYNLYRKTGAKSRIELLNLCSGNNYP